MTVAPPRPIRLRSTISTFAPERAAAMAGFDPLALCVPTAQALKAWQQRLDDLGEPHGGIVTGHAGSVLVGLRDPDGIEIRLYQPSGGES